MNDLRDPLVVGTQLLRLRADTPKATLSEVYDSERIFFEHLPPWTGNGLMSNDPAQHHSKTPQRVGTEFGSLSAPGFSE